MLSQFCADGSQRLYVGQPVDGEALKPNEWDVCAAHWGLIDEPNVAGRYWHLNVVRTAAGAITQNVYLYSASAGLVTVIRAWIDRSAIADALGLTHDQHVLLSQTIGYPKA